MRLRQPSFPDMQLIMKMFSLLGLLAFSGYSGSESFHAFKTSSEERDHQAYCDCGVTCRRESCCCKPDAVQSQPEMVVQQSSSRLCMMTSQTDQGFPESVVKLKLIHVPKELPSKALSGFVDSHSNPLFLLESLPLSSSMFFFRLDRPPRFY